MELSKTTAFLCFLEQRSVSDFHIPRSKVIDVAKGILILFLLYGHTPIFSRSQGIDDVVVGFMEDSKSFYSIFFMQSFFLITGFCSSFSKKFKIFLWKNIKTLLLPTIILSLLASYITAIFFQKDISWQPFISIFQWFYAEGPWFIVVLFISKIICWFLNKLNYGTQILVIFLLFLLGIFCNMRFWTIPEYLWYQHVLLMLPFLAMGNIAKSFYHQISKSLFPLSLLGIAFILFENLLHWKYGFTIPIIDANIILPYYFAPLHFVNVIAGTAVVLQLAKTIRTSKWLISVGSYTLLFYLWNGAIHYKIIYFMSHFYHDNNLICCILFHFTSLSLCIFISYYISRFIYGTKYLNLIVGKG